MTRSPLIGARARIANPALRPLQFLIGEWRTSGTHPLVPGEALHGRTAFSWHEGGAFLIIRSQVDHPRFPDGLAIIASDDVAGRLALSWFDERGTSRLFDVAIGARTVTWSRDHPDFSQSTTLAAEGEDRLVGRGRMKEKGKDWSDDLSQVYVRNQGATG